MRCFIAIELPEPIRRRLGRLRQDLAALDREVRWTRPEQIHLTMKFLGEVPDGDVPAVSAAAAAAVAGCEPIEIQIRGVGCFPDRGPGRVVWAGVAGPPPALVRCHEALERACANLGYAPEDRTFRPHLTIGRARDSRGSVRVRPGLAGHADFAAGGFIAAELVVFQSVLNPGGPVHTVISRAGLAGPAR